MQRTKFHGNWSTDSREEYFLKGFYHIWAWRPCWSCNQHHVHYFHFLVPESLHVYKMMDLSLKCYIPSFVEIGSLAPEKKIYKGFLPYMCVVAILVMWPASCHKIIISLYLKAYIQKLVKNGQVVS